LAPTICDPERTHTKCHPKKRLGRELPAEDSPKRPEVKSLPPLKQPSQPRIYPKQFTHIHLQSPTQHPLKPEDPRIKQSNQQPKWRRSLWTPQLQTLYLRPHSNTNTSKPKRTSNKIPRLKLKRSLKTSWHAFTNRMNAFTNRATQAEL
jgi:hypothetical protein